jgi:FemAB-related protein (PEP-CTERM system-associated)
MGTYPLNDTIVVRTLERDQADAWKDYLARQNSEILYHRLEWDDVFRRYDLPVVRLAAWRNNQIVGVLPLVWQRSWIFGNRLISLPWFDSAGVLACDQAASESLVLAATELAKSGHGAGLLLRQRQKVEAWQQDRSDKVLMRLSLVDNPEQLWKGFSAKVRNQVRKAEKSGLEAITGGAECVQSFYGVYSKNMKDLGSPSHSKGIFEAVLQAFGTDANLHIVRLHDRVVGAGLTLANGSCLEIPWASSLREFNSLCVNHLLYWHILRQACTDGYRWFHFGRSTLNSGTYQFKKQWGAEAEPLYWYQFDAGDGQIRGSQALQQEYEWAAKAWRKMPLWLTQWLGPKLMAKLP